jgi:hypothetical protein
MNEYAPRRVKMGMSLALVRSALGARGVTQPSDRRHGKHERS